MGGTTAAPPTTLFRRLYLLAALQWGIIAPLNLVKVLLNKVSPTAHLWVPKESETCQGSCGIARMWATLFWSTQIMFSIGYLYIWRYNSGRMPFVLIGGLQKLAVGTLLLKAYFEGVVHKPIGAGGALDLLMAPLLLLDASAASVTVEPFKEDESVGVGAGRTTTPLSSWVDRLRAFAARWWYPWVVGLLSGVNNFAVVLSAPLVVLYLSGVYANPGRRYVAAFANAFGTTCGVALLIYFMQARGREYMEQTFPAALESDVAKSTKFYMGKYGEAGAVIVSVMPVFLQPLVFLGVIAEMNAATLVMCVLVGRTIKYVIMAELALFAPNMLKVFGSAAVDASNKLRAEKSEGTKHE